MGFQFLRLIIANEIIKIKYRICQSAIYFCLNLLIRKELSPLNILKLVKWNNQLTICTNLTQSLVLLISLMRITREVLMRKKGLEIIGTPKGWWVHLIIQVLTGVFLAMFYDPSILYAFSSIMFINNEIYYGWWIRGLHVNGASFFFLCVYFHMFRGLYYSSFLYPRQLLWKSGVIILTRKCDIGFWISN